MLSKGKLNGDKDVSPQFNFGGRRTGVLVLFLFILLDILLYGQYFFFGSIVWYGGRLWMFPQPIQTFLLLLIPAVGTALSALGVMLPPRM